MPRIKSFKYRNIVETQAPTESAAFVLPERLYFAIEEKVVVTYRGTLRCESVVYIENHQSPKSPIICFRVICLRI